MKIAFLTEMGFSGKITSHHTNMRTEFAWMHALNADHYNIHNYNNVVGYDCVFIIFPKGRVYLSAEGSKIIEGHNPVSGLLQSNFVDALKANNTKVYYIQEGPHWWFNDYELVDQIHFYNMLTNCDAIFAHNESDVRYYRGMLGDKPVYVMPSLMIEDLIKDIVPTYEEKVIIGGNFARWYGGFESYIVAQDFGLPIWGQTSHVSRVGEEQLINVLPRLMWVDWIKQLSTFKYAVHLMPTVAAGTFSLNCAYLGIPCIGNEDVKTQAVCHPELSVNVNDIERARGLARKLKDKDFYNHCSAVAKQNYNLYSVKNWLSKINKIIE